MIDNTENQGQEGAQGVNAAAPLLADPKVQPETKVVTEPTKETPIEQEKDDFVYHVDDVEEGAGTAANGETKPAAFDRKRWKELDDDIDTENFDEEKVFSRAAAYKDKANKALILAEANEVFEKHEGIKFIKQHLSMSDEDLVLASDVAELKRVGYTQEQATEKASTRLAKLREKYPDAIEEKAEDIRMGLKGAEAETRRTLQSQIEQSRKALSLSEAPNPELLNKSIEFLGNTDTFLGLKFGSKSEQGLKDFRKPVEEGIKDGSILKKLQNDPELLAKAALFVHYEKDWTKAISKRVENAKTKVMKTLPDAPYSAGKRAVTPATTELDSDGRAQLKNPGTFK